MAAQAAGRAQEDPGTQVRQTGRAVPTPTFLLVRRVRSAESQTLKRWTEAGSLPRPGARRSGAGARRVRARLLRSRCPQGCGGCACGWFLLLEVPQRKPQQFSLSLTTPAPRLPAHGPAPAGGGLGGVGETVLPRALDRLLGRNSSGVLFTWKLIFIDVSTANVYVQS